MRLKAGQHPKKEWIDLGITISNVTRKEGEHRSLRDIAAFVQAAIEVMGNTQNSNYSWQAVSQYEQKVLRKLRVRLQFHKDPVLTEAVQHFCGK